MIIIKQKYYAYDALRTLSWTTWKVVNKGIAKVTAEKVSEEKRLSPESKYT